MLGARSNCTATCGDGIRTVTEACDNGNQAGCSYNCMVDLGWSCSK